MAPSLGWAPTLVAHITSLDEAPGSHQQHQVSPFQVLGAVGTEQPCGVAQHSQDAPVQQVVGYLRIHSSQRVIKEIEFLFLERDKGTMGTKPQVLWLEPRPHLGCELEAVREDGSEELWVLTLQQ